MRAVEGRHPPGLVVMLTGDLARYADTMSDLEVMDVPMGTGLMWFKGCLIADGLNKSLARLFDRDELQWAWLMGDDHRLPQDTLTNLLDRDKDVVVPLCLHRMPPFYTTVVDRSGDGPRALTLSDMPTGGLRKLGDGESCGDAGMLIRRNVLEGIEQPFYDQRRSGAFSSEDQAFTTKLRNAGFDVWVDCDTIIGHTTPMSVTPTKTKDGWKIQIHAGDAPVCYLNPTKG